MVVVIVWYDKVLQNKAVGEIYSKLTAVRILETAYVSCTRSKESSSSLAVVILIVLIDSLIVD